MIGLENPLHIALLALVVLLVFGAKRLPEIGRSLGTGLRGFKESISGESANADSQREATVSSAALAPGTEKP